MSAPVPPPSRPRRRVLGIALAVALGLAALTLGVAAWLAPPFEADLPSELAAYVPSDVALYAGGRGLLPLMRRAQALAGSPRGRDFLESVPARDLDARHGISRALARLGERSIPGIGTWDVALERAVERECAIAVAQEPTGLAWLAVVRVPSYAAKLACGAAIRAGTSLELAIPATELEGGLFLAKHADVVWLASSRGLLARAVGCAPGRVGSLAEDAHFKAAPSSPSEPALRIHADISSLALRRTLGAWAELAYPFPLSLWPPLVLGELDVRELAGASGWLAIDPDLALAWRGVVFHDPPAATGWLAACREGPAWGGREPAAAVPARPAAMALRAIERLPAEVIAARALALAPERLIERLRALEIAGLGSFLARYDEVARAVGADLVGAIGPHLDGEVLLAVLDAPAANGDAGVGIACILGCDRPTDVVEALDRVFSVARPTLGTGVLARKAYGGLEVRTLGAVPILADGEPSYAAVGRAVAFATSPGVLARLHDAARGAISPRDVPRRGPGLRAVRATLDLGAARGLVRRFARDIAVELVADYQLPAERERLAAASPGLAPAALDLAIEARRLELVAERARTIERGLGQYGLLDRFDLEWSPTALGLELDWRLGLDPGTGDAPHPVR